MPDTDLLLEAIYRALTRWDREMRSARNLRMALGGHGPTIKRGTKRAAMARYLTDAVLTELRARETSGEPPRCYRIFGGTHCAVHAAPFRDTAMNLCERAETSGEPR